MYVVKQQENEVIYYIIVKYIKKLRKKKQNTNKHKILYKKMTKNKEINVNIQCFFFYWLITSKAGLEEQIFLKNEYKTLLWQMIYVYKLGAHYQ